MNKEEINRAKKAKAQLKARLNKDTVEVLLDDKEHAVKPQGKEVGRITKALPQGRRKLSVYELADYLNRGCTIKASLLSSTTKDSFISSNIVALDVDNKKSYTSINDFMKLTGEAHLEPFMIYETFSSTDKHQRFRVLYRFNRLITDVNEIDKLYNYVWSLFPEVDLDYSVDYSKILYGGKKVVLVNSSINDMPDLSNVSFIKPKTVPVVRTRDYNNNSIKHITKEEIRANLEALRPLYEGQYMDRDDINEKIKLTDLLNVELGERFRCILPGHDDKHPSARIILDKDNHNEQVYICTCDGSGYRTINLWQDIFDLSYGGAIKDISNILGVCNYTDYQQKASDFVNLLIAYYDDSVPEDVRKYMNIHKITSVYFILLDMVKNKAIRPVSKNPNDIAIYASNSEIAAEMKKRDIRGYGDVNRKLSLLTSIGIVRKLTRTEIDDSTINKDNNYSNNTDYYCILDLTQERIELIKNHIATFKRIGHRTSGSNAQREINSLGKDYVRNNSRTQAYNKKKDKQVLRAVKTIIDSGVKYFSEDDVNKVMRDKNHRLTKKQAEKLIENFLNGLVDPLELERTRVNKTNRKNFKIPKNYKSNSVIYIVSDNSSTLIELIS